MAEDGCTTATSRDHPHAPPPPQMAAFQWQSTWVMPFWHLLNVPSKRVFDVGLPQAQITLGRSLRRERESMGFRERKRGREREMPWRGRRRPRDEREETCWSTTPASCRFPWPFGREIEREGERTNPLPLSLFDWPTVANQTRFNFFFWVLETFSPFCPQLMVVKCLFYP